MARQLDAAHARHLDVEQEHLRPAARQPIDDLEAVGRFPDHGRGQLSANVGQQFLQARPRRRLVIGDEHPQFRTGFACVRAHAGPVR